MIRGAVYRVDLGAPRGHPQAGKRLGVVLSPTDFPWTVATIVPSSTSAQPAIFRPEIEVVGERTLFLADQLCTLDVDYIVGDPVDYLDPRSMAEVEEAVARYLGLLPGEGN